MGEQRSLCGASFLTGSLNSIFNSSHIAAASAQGIQLNVSTKRDNINVHNFITAKIKNYFLLVLNLIDAPRLT